MTLNIATWNCTGIMSSASYLNDLMINNDLDICGISEHWLYEYDLNFLNCINGNYTSYSISDPDLLFPSNRRVGKGGIGILWKKSLNNNISPLVLQSKYIIGIEVLLGPGSYLYIFQVYMPCKNHCVLQRLH